MLWNYFEKQQGNQQELPRSYWNCRVGVSALQEMLPNCTKLILVRLIQWDKRENLEKEVLGRFADKSKHSAVNG